MSTRKRKFKSGEVVSLRNVYGGWEYDLIGSIRPGDDVRGETAWLVNGAHRRETKTLRKLTRRERGGV